MLDDLDERPNFIESKDLHSTWCSAAALAEFKLQDMLDPADGVIHRDEIGKATGLLSEAATMIAVWPFLAKATLREDKLKSIREAIKTYSAAGCAGMMDTAMDENAWEALEELRSKEELSIRLAAYWLISPSNTDEENMAQVDRAIALHDDFRIAGIKVICDGVILAFTAAPVRTLFFSGSLL